MENGLPASSREGATDQTGWESRSAPDRHYAVREGLRLRQASSDERTLCVLMAETNLRFPTSNAKDVPGTMFY
jgi:hypothetical protein